MLEMAGARLRTAGAYELAILNPDKPPLSPEDAAARLDRFAGHEAVWLTRAPTFPEKARLFPGATFAVGVDTLVRIAEPATTAARRVSGGRSPSSARADSSCSGASPTRGSRPWSRWTCPRRSGHFATDCRRPTSGPTSRPPTSAGPEGASTRRTGTRILEASSSLQLSRDSREAPGSAGFQPAAGRTPTTVHAGRMPAIPGEPALPGVHHVPRRSGAQPR